MSNELLRRRELIESHTVASGKDHLVLELVRVKAHPLLYGHRLAAVPAVHGVVTETGVLDLDDVAAAVHPPDDKIGAVAMPFAVDALVLDQEIGLFGVSVSFSPPKKGLAELSRNFPQALNSLLERMADHARGLFIALDDINGLAENPEFANWYKSFADQVAIRYDHFPVLMMLIGLYMLGMRKELKVIGVAAETIGEAAEEVEQTTAKAGKKIERIGEPPKKGKGRMKEEKEGE